MDKYIVRIADIELKTGFVFTQFTQTQKNKLAATSWVIPKDCDKSRKYQDNDFDDNDY